MSFMGTIPESLNSVHKVFMNIVPNRPLGIPLSSYLFAGLATASLLFTFRDGFITEDTSKDSPSNSNLKSQFESQSNSKITSGPLTTHTPNLSREEVSALPYPPDIFPGARDVPSPYGSTRAYEFGPLSGPKVLLIHGISTPCISLHSLATTLATSHGYRVLLFDLFGRGYSDGVADLPHDERLYTTQILLVLTSSSSSWVQDGFNIVGFSMGGGIAVDFAVGFPEMIKGVILLAPGGLIRPQLFGWKGKMMRKWWFPDDLWGWILRRRVITSYEDVSNPSNSLPSPSSLTFVLSSENKLDETQGQVISELTNAISSSSPITNSDSRISFDDTPVSPSLPNITVGQVMRWQTQQHRGYANAFASSIMYASISGCEETWKRLWETRQSNTYRGKSKSKRREKVLVVVGEWDDVIIAEELKEDLDGVVANLEAESFGNGGVDERVVWKVVKGAGHEFPITRGEEVAGLIRDFLAL